MSRRLIARWLLLPAVAATAWMPSVAANQEKGSVTERELTVTAPDGLAMGATLTLPASGQPRAALVLATGSGTQNRDEEVFGKHPFRTIAEYLSARGYAVLRVDDRGFDSPSDATGATMATFISDVASAFAVADSMFAGIPTGILGHSSGGSYAIANAAANPGVDFIITLAAPAWRGDSLVMAQARAIATAMTGRWDGDRTQRYLLDVAASDMPPIAARAMLTSAISEQLGDAAKLPAVSEQIQQQVSGMLSPWYRSMLRYDPAADIAAVDRPWLALNGERDMQVPVGNLSTIHDLNPSAVTKTLEGHNHIFLQCSTGLPQEYATLPGDISAATLEAIALWLDGLTSEKDRK